MRKFLVFIIFLLSTTFAFGALKETDKQALTSFNFLNNGGFENGKAQWNKSTNGTFDLDTSTPVVGRVSGIWDATAQNDYLESDLYTVPRLLQGKDCVLSYSYSGSPSGLISAQALDSVDTELGVAVLSDAGSSVVDGQVNFTCPASGTVKLRFKVAGAGDPAALTIDNVFFGKATVVATGAGEEISRYLASKSRFTVDSSGNSFGTIAYDHANERGAFIYCDDAAGTKSVYFSVINGKVIKLGSTTVIDSNACNVNYVGTNSRSVIVGGQIYYQSPDSPSSSSVSRYYYLGTFSGTSVTWGSQIFKGDGLTIQASPDQTKGVMVYAYGSSSPSNRVRVELFGSVSANYTYNSGSFTFHNVIDYQNHTAAAFQGNDKVFISWKYSSNLAYSAVCDYSGALTCSSEIALSPASMVYMSAATDPISDRILFCYNSPARICSAINITSSSTYTRSSDLVIPSDIYGSNKNSDMKSDLFGVSMTLGAAYAYMGILNDFPYYIDYGSVYLTNNVGDNGTSFLVSGNKAFLGYADDGVTSVFVDLFTTP